VTTADSWRAFVRAISRHRRLPIALVAVALVLVSIVFVLRGRIDRAAAATILSMSGARDVAFEGMRSEGGRWLLDAVHFRDATSNISVDAQTAGIGLDWRGARPFITLSLVRPHLTISASTTPALEGLARTALHAPPVGRGLHVEIFGATVEVLGLRSRPIVVDQVAGTIDNGLRRLTYDLRGKLLEDGRAYPFAARADAEGKTVVHRWSASALPAAVVGAVLHAGGIEVRDGLVGDVAVRFTNGRDLRADGKLSAATVVVDGFALHGVSGGIALDHDELATNELTGTFDDATVSVRGDTRFADLALLRELFDNIAGEEHLQTVRLESVAPGVVFAKYVTRGDEGPLAIHLLDVDPNEPTVRFDTVLAGDHVFSGAERTSSMAARTGAIAGINGDYFDIGGTSAPQGLMIRDGALVHAPTALREALIVHRDKSFSFDLFRFHGTATTSRGTAPITLFNDWPPGDVAVITPDLGKIPASPNVMFVSLAGTTTPGRYRVEDVSPLPERRVATFGLAFGPLVRSKLPRRGEEIDVRYTVTPGVDDAVAAVASGPLLLKDGKWYEDPHAPAPGEREVRWPVVGVGTLPSKRLLWVAVDGRWYDVSIGMTRPEFAALLQRFGVNDAIALDSGGSVTMVSRVPGDDVATVRNHPSDSGGERWVANGLFVYSSARPSPLADVLRTRTLGALP